MKVKVLVEIKDDEGFTVGYVDGETSYSEEGIRKEGTSDGVGYSKVGLDKEDVKYAVDRIADEALIQLFRMYPKYEKSPYFKAMHGTANYDHLLEGEPV